MLQFAHHQRSTVIDVLVVTQGQFRLGVSLAGRRTGVRSDAPPQSPIDRDSLPVDAKRVPEAIGSIRGIDWEETEEDLERIARESTPTPPIEFDE